MRLFRDGGPGRWESARESALSINPATAVTCGNRGNSSQRLLCLAFIRTMVMGGVAAQRVQPVLETL